MKKIIATFSLIAFSLIINAQMTVVTYEGVQINDGDIFAFNTTNPSSASIYFYINNNSNEPINVKIKCEEILNTNGENFEFCFSELCILSVEEGVTYPDSDENPYVVIPPGGTNPEFDHFLNLNTGSGTFPLDYVFRFFQVDANQNEIGESITFTYRYDPNLSTDDFENSLGVALQNTIATDFLSVRSMNPLNYEIFNINGQLISFNSIGSGVNNVNVSNLNNGVYFIRFADENGSTTTMKFVVK